MKELLAEEIVMYLSARKAITYDDVQIVPRYSETKHRADIKTECRLVKDIMITHPLIPANMDSISSIDMCMVAENFDGFCFLHRFKGDIHEYLSEIRELWVAGHNVVGVSLGTSDHDKWVAEQIVQEFRNKKLKFVFLIDVAHGHHVLVKEMIHHLKGSYPWIPVIAGNVATYQGAYDLCEWGADGIKVGVGPGSLCTTRINTGAGVPQFSAVAMARKAVDNWCEKEGIPLEVDGPTIIADGGIKWPGDILKAIGAGANTVMSGYLFAGTDCTPGNIHLKGLFPNQTEWKVYRGSASRESKLDRGETSNIEGESTEILYKGSGSTERIFMETLDGIKSGLSYAGHENLNDAVGDIHFTLVSDSSITEAGPNALYRN